MTKALHIAIEPFKRSQYDRGSKKILVDGEEWGWIEMIGHGCNGPTYHAHDRHGPVVVGHSKHSGERFASFRPKSPKGLWRQNIGKPDHMHIKHVPTDQQLAGHVGELIATGHLRSPEARDREIKARHENYLIERKKADTREEMAFRDRAMAAIPATVTTLLHDNLPPHVAVKLCNELTDAITEAMRWAQTQ